MYSWNRIGMIVVSVVPALAVWVSPAGAGEVPFTERVISTTADGANTVFVADIDGDGASDVLSASGNDDKIAWYENDGGSLPSFSEHIISTNADSAWSVFARDVDGDGDTDVLSASIDDDKIAWYESDGGSPPGFTERVISTAANGAYSVFAADVDGDGDTDVLSASYYDDKIAWYENDGGSPPSFSEHIISTNADGARCVFAADVDGDGDSDVLSASRFDNKIAWYENDGGSLPSFSEHIISTNADDAESVVAADVDGDGDSDVLSASFEDDKIAWYENDGGLPPSFSEHIISTNADGARCVFAADVDGDGDSDVLSASGFDDKIAWYESGLAGPVFNVTTGQSYATIASAFDAAEDGHFLTAAVERFAAEPTIDFLGQALTLRARGPLEQPSGGLYTLADDAALLAAPGWEIELAGELDTPMGARVEVEAAALAVTLSGELSADGGATLIVATDTGATLGGQTTLAPNALTAFSADVTLGGALPEFAERVISTNANGATCVFAADVDGDGDTDVLSAFSYRIKWYENDGGSPPGFTERTISAIVLVPVSVCAADVDGDGDTDVLSAMCSDDEIAWYENDGGSPPGFTERIISTDVDCATSVFAADVDGDGHTDALSASDNDHKIAWYENDGGAPPGFTQQVISTSASYAASVFAADVDDDGDTDVLAAFQPEEIVWYENDGASPPGFTERVIATNADWPRSVFAADLDGDGDTDVLSASGTDDKIAWYENDGGTPPSFTGRIISTTADEAWSVFAADVDGDGDTDVLSASRKDDKIAWYEAQLGSATLSPGSVLLADGALFNHVPTSIYGGTLASDAALQNSEFLEVLGGFIEAGLGLINATTGVIEGFADVYADVTNAGSVLLVADTQVVGDYTNDGTTTIQNGTLTILGTLTNNGEIVGDFSARSGGGFFVEGAFVAGPGAALLMASEAACVGVGGDYDVAIASNQRYDMALAELRMVGLGGAQRLERMSEDIGPIAAGLDRTQPGHYPIGTLRIGPTPTTVALVDDHDNDGLGQGTCEAVYLQELIIESGATLLTNGYPVYYVSLTLDGTVDDSDNLVAILPVPGDADGDGDVDLDDYALFSDCLNGPDSWPDPTPPTTPQDCLDAFNFDADFDVDLADFAGFQAVFTGSSP